MQQEFSKISPSFDSMYPVASLGEFDRRLARARTDFKDFIFGCNTGPLNNPIRVTAEARQVFVRHDVVWDVATGADDLHARQLTER